MLKSGLSFKDKALLCVQKAEAYEQAAVLEEAKVRRSVLQDKIAADLTVERDKDVKAYRSNNRWYIDQAVMYSLAALLTEKR